MTTKKTAAAKTAPKKKAAPRAAKSAKVAKTEVATTLAETTADSVAGLTLAQQEALTVDITFADLGLSDAMLASLKSSGYTRPTPIQQQAVPLALKGRDLMGLAQTGTGKTAAFTIPIIERLIGGPKRTRALVLTPTRELCQQVEASVRKYGVGT
jgi:superfamily II DNA/RNA helicase